MKCPKCGGFVECDDFERFTCDEEHVDYCCGHCIDCGTDYQWKDVYKFLGHQDVQEVSLN